MSAVECLAGVTATLTWYAPGEQPEHAHDFDTLSCLLAGEIRETSFGEESDLSRPSVGFKPAGARHRDRWGPSGALIFSLAGVARVTAVPSPGWRGIAAPARFGRLARQCLLATCREAREEAASDFIDLATTVREDSPPGTTPAWLSLARDRLREEPAETPVAALAEELGVHRVYLSRLFRRHFGVPPSVYRRRCLAARAVAAAAGGVKLSEAAQEAGFCDQSHAARSVRSDTGFNLSELRRLASGLHPSKPHRRG